MPLSPYSPVRRGLPWLVWLAAAGGAAWLWSDLATPGQAVGLAEVREIALAPTRNATVRAVTVRTGQAVAAGELVAACDTAVVDAEIAVLDAEIRLLGRELERRRVSLVSERLEQSRRLAADAGEVTLELARARAAEEQLRHELELLDAEVARQADLVGQSLASADRLHDLQRRQNAHHDVAGDRDRAFALVVVQVGRARSRAEAGNLPKRDQAP